MLNQSRGECQRCAIDFCLELGDDRIPKDRRNVFSVVTFLVLSFFRVREREKVLEGVDGCAHLTVGCCLRRGDHEHGSLEMVLGVDTMKIAEELGERRRIVPHGGIFLEFL